MLSPEWLRKRTKEAEEILERERKEAEARRLMAEELRRVEEEKLRRINQERERARKVVERTVSAFVRAAIRAAAGGARSAEIKADSLFLTTEYEAVLMQKLQDIGYECYIRDSSKRWVAISRIVGKMLSRVASVPGTEYYRDQIVTALESHDERRLLELSHGLCADESFALPPSDDLFIRLHVIRELESEEEDQFVCSLNGCWQPADVLDARFVAVYQVPSWMVSRSGSWLMERMGHCHQRDANLGLRTTEFQLIDLPMNPERWGANSMTKFVYAGEPIGTTPFSARVTVGLLRILGFKVLLESVASTRVLKVSW